MHAYTLIGVIEDRPDRRIHFRFDNRRGLEMHYILKNDFPLLFSDDDLRLIERLLDQEQWDEARDILRAKGITHLHTPRADAPHLGELTPIDQAQPWTHVRTTVDQIARERRRARR